MNIENFKNAIGGGVRPALFRVGGPIGGRGVDGAVSLLVTAAAIPASTIGEVTAPYRGRTVNFQLKKV